MRALAEIVPGVIPLPVLGKGARAPDRPPAAPSHLHAPRRRLIDSRHRTIRDLRLSITDRCNFRCVYCLEPGARFLPSQDLLTVDELVRLARISIGLGVETVRITGGEPTVHPQLTEIIRAVAAAGAPDLAMTTNGHLVDDKNAAAWRAAGLSRITVSLDSTDPERFSAISRSSSSPERVIEAVRVARRAGFERTKMNAVIIRGINESDIIPLAALARELGIEVRYIEFMPLDAGRAWDATRFVPAAEIAAKIDARYPLTLVGRDDPSSTSLCYDFADGAPGRIGLIAPVSRPFCGACSRLRITADGKVRPCLFSLQEWDLRPLLRSGAKDEQIEDFLIDATWTKQAGHGITSPGFVQPERTMSAIGG
jgi:cyclic pyranopterin phosphate synthase